MPGLTRQFICYEKTSCEDRWMPGSSPGMTSRLSTRLRDLAAHFARVFCGGTSCPLRTEGAGSPRRRCPMLDSASDIHDTSLHGEVSNISHRPHVFRACRSYPAARPATAGAGARAVG